ncbi:deoxynucleoside kinase [Rhodocaloribacter litoris]|uniref:deoxynucleoside kinase n=1 Tax=Rhodocaloribacter litoris TaxID=2558931 RepID=UPI00141E1BB7|nr:deoxynucleoside kinase [Rhodocaloribacter litoris]QXD14661.1 deoxynucleoside kinase [Rhodocaloribacter litoris]GIV59563.1 MAG: deoxyadenosine kinase [Rhodothermaceae bacterium]
MEPEITPGPQAPAPPVTPHEDLRYLVIEGVIGAGKTTLARLLAERFNARLVLEAFDENPFLARFYEDRRRWAFHTQLSFLASRFRQQQNLLKRDLFQQLVISDYSFDKDRIFAHLNLEGDERRLYDTLFTLMQPVVPTPDLVVYLQCTTERLLQNIARRGRPYEKDMDPDYIDTLNRAYNHYFYHYTKSPLLIIHASHIDFVRNPDELEELVRQIMTIKHPGTTYFNPTPSGSLHL